MDETDATKPTVSAFQVIGLLQHTRRASVVSRQHAISRRPATPGDDRTRAGEHAQAWFFSPAPREGRVLCSPNMIRHAETQASFTEIEYRDNPRRVIEHAVRTGRAVVVRADGSVRVVISIPPPETS